MSVEAKWDAIYSKSSAFPSEAVEVLQWHQHLLPSNGIALDLACGLGANSLWLARQGLQVLSWDISSVAIAKLNERARAEQLVIQAEQRDVIAYPPATNSVDVLVVSHFLDRALIPALIQALKPNGLVFYQTYCQQKVDNQVGPTNPNYLLADNELLSLFSTLRLRVYREESLTGNKQQGWRNQAMLVAQNN